MKILSKLLFCSILLSGQAMAATIGWESSPASVNIGDNFSLKISGSSFTNNVDGGGVNFSYDSSILNVVSISIDETVWDFGGFGISTGLVDNGAGTVDGIMVNTFSVVTGSFDVATVQFQAVGSGTSALSLTGYQLNPWASGGSLINPTIADSSLTVLQSGITPVPVPAAVWLFGSGLLGLIGLARRKTRI